MARKTLFCLITCLMLFSFSASADDPPQPGFIFFTAGTTGDGHKAFSLRFERTVFEAYELKAVRVTFQPVGQIALLAFPSGVPAEELEGFAGDRPSLAVMETGSLSLLNPRVFYGDRAVLQGNDRIEVDYLVEIDGELFSLAGPEFRLEDLFAHEGTSGQAADQEPLSEDM